MNNRKGFTLIELIITMVILSIVMGLIVGLVTQSMKFFNDEEQQVANQASLRQIAVEFEKNVRRHVISSTEFEVSGNCYVIKPIFEDDINYCFDSVNFTVERDGLVIGERVGQFSANYDSSDDSIALIIQSRPDGYGRINEVSVRIYIRVGN